MGAMAGSQALYLRPSTKFSVHGVHVPPTRITEQLTQRRCYPYTHQESKTQVEITLGRSSSPTADSGPFGMCVYHRGRLVDVYRRLGAQIAQGSKHPTGVGVVGVMEADFLMPLLHKQGFDTTRAEYVNLLSALTTRLRLYCSEPEGEGGGGAGDAPRQSTSKDATTTSLYQPALSSTTMTGKIARRKMVPVIEGGLRELQLPENWPRHVGFTNSYLWEGEGAPDRPALRALTGAPSPNPLVAIRPLKLKHSAPSRRVGQNNGTAAGRGKAYGLFARSRLRGGEWIGDYTGTMQRLDTKTSGKHTYEIPLEHYGNETRYIKDLADRDSEHSVGNVEIHPYHDDVTGELRIGVFAVSSIDENSQIIFE
ncbi:hypothetical protein CYMTET_26007 [Cymbomonas tetramitiformis]|uniref:Morc S5 domain-containing protein n=1 Tax=Cymbomonas tetramitiformis TaxID=36881 RepID=A0AAE0KYL4_9CHLO|nr:hypothetical protein CYMTET_26007 [Cymbomonas tetramitiformis]